MQLQQIQALIEKAQLDAQEEDCEEPYAELYARAEDLKQQIDQLQAQAAGTPSQELSLQLAVLQGRRGVVLLETDLLADGEACIAAGLPVLEAAGTHAVDQPSQQQEHGAGDTLALQPEHLGALQAMYNALGALWSRRGDFDKALAWLSKAEQLGQQAGAQHDSTTNEPDSLTAAAKKLVTGYTSTLFFLAQVHGHAGHKEQSASYCAATLQRQLESGSYDRSEWVQNCLQLAGFYCSCQAFANAQHCIRAANLVAAGEPQQQGAQTGGRAEASADAAAPTTPATTSLVVDDDVAANLSLSAAKLCRLRLLCSHQQHVLGQAVSLPGRDGVPPLAAPVFASLSHHFQPPAYISLGTEPLVSSYVSARDLCNEGMEHYNAALKFYQLDGWVTEHVNILMEVSHMFMLLAGFEPDAGRRAAMHKQRTVRLQPACGNQLNAEHYLGLVRAVELESGNAWRDCLEARTDAADAGGPVKPAQAKALVAAAQSAANHYGTFLSTFQLQPGARVNEEDEDSFLSACFSLGRMLHRCASEGRDCLPQDKQLVYMMQAQKHLSSSCDYVKRHAVAEFKQEAALADELATLLVEKINLYKRLQAGQANKA